jgi:hypothetical protein
MCVMDILDAYVKGAPSPQEAINIFSGEWTSKFPDEYQLQAGHAGVFEDHRIVWAINQLGGITGQSIIELGPLEGGHSYMLEKLGAGSVLSIEANTRAYLKCLITKEVLDLKRVKFLCGNFIEYLRNTSNQYDLCIASGVLYHMENPVELIELVSKVAPRVMLWTHYYDRQIVSQGATANQFTGSKHMEHKGFSCTLYTYEYQKALDWKGFCGGVNSFSHWLSREDIIACLGFFGYQVTATADVPEHPHGPCLALVAERR